MTWLKKNGWTLLVWLLFLTGLVLLLYPSVGRYLSQRKQSGVIVSYVENIGLTDQEQYDVLWAEAVSHNEELAQSGICWLLDEEELQAYNGYLDTDGTGIMAYIDIPVIECLLPIYHGTSEQVLQKGAGHIEGSSLPVGGESTHCILTGHTGLPSARLFTDIDRLKEGDTFTLHTLDRTLTYEVDRISIVEPTDLSELTITEGEDYCTLVTCTPYGINTHRLLVRGRRVENP